MNVTIRLAQAADAPAMLAVSRAAFAARRPADPPPAALGDTLADYERSLEAGWGVVAESEGRIVGSLLIAPDGDLVTLRRVSVRPEAAGNGVARDMVGGAAFLAADAGFARIELACRPEFPELAAWWREHGFEHLRDDAGLLILGRDLPVALDIPTADDMRALGRRIAALLKPGDVIIATGDLGAGKTTLTQGLGEGLGVEGPVTSPTFVISRIHRSSSDGPDLVHVDAYRMGGVGELADIDLDATLSTSVTLVEWGEGIAEWLSEDRLEIIIDRGDVRHVTITGVGPRWAGALEPLRKP